MGKSKPWPMGQDWNRLIPRRQFLKLIGTGAASLAVMSPRRLLLAQEKPERKGPAKKVIVIGAGLAGLSAGYELNKLGHEVLIFEARRRPGGRVLTLREPFADGLYVEAGAIAVSESMGYVMKYLREFNLTLTPYFPASVLQLDSMIIARGQHFRFSQFAVEPSRLLPGLTAEEGRWFSSTPPFLWLWPALQRYAKELGDPTKITTSPLAALDKISLHELLSRNGASSEALAWLHTLNSGTYIGYTGDSLQDVSALATILNVAASHAVGLEPIFYITGGNDRLPYALAMALKERIHYASVVVRLLQTEGGVEVTVVSGGRHETVKADRVICTVPLSVMSRIECTPPLSPLKQRAAQEVRYSAAQKIFLQCRRRYWEEEGLSGTWTTDLPIGSIFHATANQPGPRGILHVYSLGEKARKLQQLKTSEQIDLALRTMASFSPKLTTYCESGVTTEWMNDEWSHGAWALFAPGQVTEFTAALARAEGRLHFAGEHTSALWQGSQNGALASGNRAAHEVDEA